MYCQSSLKAQLLRWISWTNSFKQVRTILQIVYWQERKTINHTTEELGVVNLSVQRNQTKVLNLPPSGLSQVVEASLEVSVSAKHCCRRQNYTVFKVFYNGLYCHLEQSILATVNQSLEQLCVNVLTNIWLGLACLWCQWSALH